MIRTETPKRFLGNVVLLRRAAFVHNFLTTHRVLHFPQFLQSSFLVRLHVASLLCVAELRLRQKATNDGLYPLLSSLSLLFSRVCGRVYLL